MTSSPSSAIAGGKVRNAVIRFVGSGNLSFYAIAMALLLLLPCLWMPISSDDHVHRAMLLSSLLPGVYDYSLFGLFSWTNGDPVRNQWLKDFGTLPWWVPDNAKLALWRPLSEATHWVDYKLFADRPWVMHLQSLFWYGLALIGVAKLYKSTITHRWTAHLAILLFALDSTHSVPVMVVCNRNAILSLLFIVYGLYLHHQWRSESSLRAGLLSWACIVLALAAGEVGLAIFAYLFSYAVFMDKGGWPSRLKSLIPAALIGVCWVLIYVKGGFGSSPNGSYIDPVAQPLAFIAALGERGPVLLLSQFFGIPADLYVLAFFANLEIWHVLFACLMLAALALLFVKTVAISKMHRFWLVGMLLAILPVAATAPGDRLLVAVGVGGMPLLAALLSHLFGVADESSGLARGKLARVFFWVLLVANVILAPLLKTATIPLAYGQERKFTVEPALDIKSSETDANKTWFIVNTANPYGAQLMPFIRLAYGEPIPKSMRILTPGEGPWSIERISPNEFLISSAASFRLNASRGHIVPFETGQTFKLEGMRATIVQLGEYHNPTSVSFKLDLPLENASYRWLSWKDGRLVDFTLPAVGATITVGGK